MLPAPRPGVAPIWRRRGHAGWATLRCLPQQRFLVKLVVHSTLEGVALTRANMRSFVPHAESMIGVN